MTDTSPASLIHRPRRLRQTAALRSLLQETHLSPAQCMLPLFITAERNVVRPILSMPGHAQWSVDRLDEELDSIAASGVQSVLLFGIPETKDENGSAAWSPEGPVPRAIAKLKHHSPGIVVAADVCLCEYTSHGHCGTLNAAQTVENDSTLELLAKAAVAYANAGADIVAPSAMMDGQIAALRAALGDAGHSSVPIMAYSAKFASAFYGPFREAAGSTPAFGDRRTYQMNPPNRHEALREVQLDIDQGADIVMVKPAGSYLDIIRDVREYTNHPLAAYQVSGEYAMIKAASERGWIDERRAALESLVAIRRAGADLVITYYAKQVAPWMKDAE